MNPSAAMSRTFTALSKRHDSAHEGDHDVSSMRSLINHFRGFSCKSTKTQDEKQC